MKLILIMLALTLFVIGPVAADNVFDNLGDIAKGRNEDIPVDLYIAKTFKDVPYTFGDIRIKGSTPYGDKFFEEGRIQIGLEY